ncbi:hypothetical protein JAAARDRAFT_71897 [Jaapia argillacea MUCL 33604]|uniref:Uncharacterized protein n=1 Tax=Jaapia argillacea MUCL 33604 TaxID=933084 RepID=A0A067PTJ1_9AGAM|nr:hypothetical protein JAAARDRAFT_71897 [Jaapia argillacea MUCL 33604]
MSSSRYPVNDTSLRQHVGNVSKAEALAALAVQERQLIDRLTLIRSVHNSLASISSLTDALLLEVFNLVRNSGGVAEEWRVVTYVCRRWRQIAVNTPALWDHVHFRSPHRYWAQEHINRSGSTLLSVRIEYLPWKLDETSEGSSGDDEDSDDDEQPKSACRQWLHDVFGITNGLLSRTKSLVLHLHREPDPPFDLRQLSTQPLYLETLQINCLFDLLLEDDCLFDGQVAPSLRTLILRHVCIPWSAPLFSGLASLSISNVEAGESNSPEAFVGMLSRCQGMEVLHLCQSPAFEPDAVEDGEVQAQEISLPNLRSLTIDGEDSVQVSWLTHYLLVPPTAVIRIGVDLKDVEEEGILRRYSVANHPVKTAILAIKYLQVTVGFNKVTLQGTCVYHSSTSSATKPWTLDLRLCVNSTDMSDSQVLNELGPLLLGSGLEVLVIDYVHSPSEPEAVKMETWTSLFQNIPKLLRLSIRGRDSSGLLEALSMPRSLICPMLTGLHYGCSSPIPVVTRFLETRKGSLLTRLVLDPTSGRSMSKGDVNKMKRLVSDFSFGKSFNPVDEVTWDETQKPVPPVRRPRKSIHPIRRPRQAPPEKCRFAPGS